MNQTSIVVKWYKEFGEMVVFSELGQKKVESLSSAFVGIKDLTDKEKREFLSELNKHGRAFVRKGGFLYEVSYTGAFPTVDF